MPLILETLILVVVAYLIGVGIGFLLFGRKRSDRFAD